MDRIKLLIVLSTLLGVTSIWSFQRSLPLDPVYSPHTAGNNPPAAREGGRGCDVRVFIWSSQWLFFSPGHAMVTAMDHSVLLSNFPRGPDGVADGRDFKTILWNALAGHPDNRRFSFIETIAEEGRLSDWEFIIHLPDEKGLLCAVIDRGIKASTWAPFSGNSRRTQCTTSATFAFSQGGLSGIDAMLPDTLAAQLRALAAQPSLENGASVTLVYHR